jgi:hypothetical protein
VDYPRSAKPPISPYKAGVGGSSPSTPTNRNPLATGGFVNAQSGFLPFDASEKDAPTLAWDSPKSREITQSCALFVHSPRDSPPPISAVVCASPGRGRLGIP